MPVRPALFDEHAMLLSEPSPVDASMRSGASLSVWSSGWPFTVAMLERPAEQPLRALRPPPIVLMTVADSVEGWPLTPQQQILKVSRDSKLKREGCSARLPPPGLWINFSVSFRAGAVRLEAAGCTVSASLGRGHERISLGVWGAVDPQRAPH
jgi:hypothetical protein